MSMNAQVQGLPGLLKRFRTMDFAAGPAREFLRDWSDELKKESQKTVRVFRGDTKASMDSEVDDSTFPVWAKVFTENPVGRWLQYGTGALSEDPQSAHQAYMPSVEGLRDWSSTKGLDPHAVALGILSRGGTPPTHFFSDAEQTVSSKMSGQLARFGGMIEFEAGKAP